MRKKLGYRDDDVVCIFVGRLIPEKGIDILIDAIKDTDDKIKLLVVGGTAFSDSSKNEFSEKLYSNKPS